MKNPNVISSVIKASFFTLFMLLVLAACAPPTTTPANKTPLPIPTFIPLSSPTYPTGGTLTAASPTQTPSPAEEISPSMPTLIMQKWFDAMLGWAVTGEDNPQLICSEDGGQTWHNVMPAPRIHIDAAYNDLFFLNPTTAWLLTRVGGDLASTGTLYHTLNGGVNWQSFTSPFSTALLTFLDANNGWAVVTKNCDQGCLVTLYKTSDAGQTWSVADEVRSPTGESSLPPGTLHLSTALVSFQNQNTLWIYGTQDGVNPTGSLMVSQDGDKTWSERILPASNAVPNILPVFLNKQQGFTYLWTKEGPSGILMTQDGGETWVQVPAPLDSQSGDPQVQFVTAKDWFIQCNDKLCVTHDGGQSWKNVPSNLVFDDQHSLVSLDFIDEQTGWALVNSPGLSRMPSFALYHTTDGGQTWNLLQSKLFTKTVPTLTPLPTAAVTNLPLEAPTPAPTVLVTPGRFPSLSQVQFIDPLNAFAVTTYTSRLLRTIDGGRNWIDITPTGIKTGLPDILNANTLWFSNNPSDNDPTVDPSTTKDTVYRSTDAGRTWQKFPAPFSKGLIKMLDANEGWVAASPNGCGAGSCWYQLYITQDGGQTWTLLKPNLLGGEPILGEGTLRLQSGQFFTFQSLDTIWMGGGVIDYGTPVLLVSHDRGQTWQGVDIQLPDSLMMVEMEVPVFLNASDGFLALTVQPAGTPFPQNNAPRSLVVFVTQDGGLTWSPHPAFQSGDWGMHPQFVTSRDWFMPCANQICRTRDGGQTWQALNFLPGMDASYFQFGFADPQNGWALVTHSVSESTDYNQLYLTHDGGETWEMINPVSW